MGYFKRRVDRRRSAKATRAAERRALAVVPFASADLS